MEMETKNTKLAIQTNFLGVMLAVGSFSSLLVESETILRAGISLCICGGTLSSTLLTCTSKYTHDNHSWIYMYLLHYQYFFPYLHKLLKACKKKLLVL